MINQIIKFEVKNEFIDDFYAALVADKQGTLNESGNLEMKIFVDKNQPNIFFAYERWEDQAAIDYHLAQSYTKKVLALCETTLQSPIEALTLGETLPAPVASDKRKLATPEDDVFIIFFIFKIKPGYKTKMLERFKTHIEHTRQEEGNLLFDLYTVEGADDTLAVYEHWQNESAVWDIHFKQPYSDITGALMAEAVEGDLKQYMNFVTEIK